MPAPDDALGNSPRGRELRLDPNAESANDAKPAFLARPEGARVYHGFATTDVIVDGFTLGEITPFEGEQKGDAFVLSPDGSPAGLIWELGPGYEVDGTSYVDGSGRWGVFHVVFECPFITAEDYRTNLAGIVGRLLEEWQRFTSGRAPDHRST
jgi:hypothetical protein